MGIANIKESFSNDIGLGYKDLSADLTEDRFELRFQITNEEQQGEAFDVGYTVELKSSFAERLTYIQDQESVMPDWIKTIVAYVRAYFQTDMLDLKDFRIRSIAEDLKQTVEEKQDQTPEILKKLGELTSNDRVSRTEKSVIVKPAITAELFYNKLKEESSDLSMTLTKDSFEIRFQTPNERQAGKAFDVRYTIALTGTEEAKSFRLRQAAEDLVQEMDDLTKTDDKELIVGLFNELTQETGRVSETINPVESESN